MVQAVCAEVNRAEGEDPPPVILRDAPTVLSWGATTRYAGGGIPPVR